MFVNHIRHFLLLLALLICAERGAAQEIVMRENGTQTVDMVPGVTYRIYDPGGRAAYPLRCDSWLHLRGPEGSTIRLSGATDLAFINDTLVIYNDSVARGAPQRYMEHVGVSQECASGHALLHFHTDAYTWYPGYVVDAVAECGGTREITGVWSRTGESTASLAWSDSSGATSWTVEWGEDFQSLDHSLSAQTTRAALTGLQPNTTYFYRITNNQGESHWASCVPVHKFTTACPGDAPEVVHRVDWGPVLIEADTTCLRHVVAGYTTDTTHTVRIARGFRGTVVLRGLEMDFSASRRTPPIFVEGEGLVDNMNPVTVVDFILDGNNTLITGPSYGPPELPEGYPLMPHKTFAAIHVDQGITARFSAVMPGIHSSGTLCIPHTRGTAIGASAAGWVPGSSRTWTTSSTGRSSHASGGNIVVQSGIIHTHTYMSPGLGGSAGDFWAGTLLVCGGMVHNRVHGRSNSMGQGTICDHTAAAGEMIPNSSVIQLPPARVDSYGHYVDVIWDQNFGTPELPNRPFPLTLYPFHYAWSSQNILRCGDTALPHFTFRTADNLAGATIYADFTGREAIRRVCDAHADHSRFDLAAVPIGVTDATGKLELHLDLGGAFLFTDAVNGQGRQYGRVSAYLGDASTTLTVTIPLLPYSHEATPHPAPLLSRNYTAQAAQDTAFVLRLVWNDSRALTGLGARYHGDPLSDYLPPQCLGADSATLASLPPTLAQGDTLFLRCPLRTGLATGHHEDFLLVEGAVNGSPVTLRFRLDQYVMPFEQVTVCEPRTSYTLGNGQVVWEDGIYTDTITPLSVINHADSSVFMCDGTEYLLTDPSMQMYDSIAAIQVRFFRSPSDTLVHDGCDSLWWHGRRYTTSGTYFTTSPSNQSCDSLHRLDLTLHYSYNFDWAPRFGCDFYVWRGDTIWNDHDTTIVELMGSDGNCDSTSTLRLHMHPSYDHLLDTLHTCYSVSWYEYTFSEPGCYYAEHMSQSWWGCDSLLRQPLRVHDTARALVEAQGCDSLRWEGTLYLDDQHFLQYGTDRYGCDSISDVSLLVHPSYRTHNVRYLCREDEPLFYHGEYYYTPGDYSVHLTSRHGCDSVEGLVVEMGRIAQPAIVANPPGASPEALDITLRDTYGDATFRRWTIDGEPWFSPAQSIQYSYPYGRDSVEVWLMDNNKYNCPDSVRLVLPFGRGALWVPNAFTPELSTNNRFRLFADGLASAEVTVYTRQGLRVTSFDGLTQEWDGRGCPAGAYTYIIRYATLSAPNTPQIQKGTVLLIR